MLTLFMQDKNLYLIALLSHWLNSYLIICIMLGFCAFMRVFLSPFIRKVTFIYTPVCLYLMCNLNACYVQLTLHCVMTTLFTLIIDTILCFACL